MKKLLERLVKKMAKDYLPTYRYSDNIKKSYQDRFGGYNHTLSSEDGEIYDEKNITSDYYPVLSPRMPRYYYDQNDSGETRARTMDYENIVGLSSYNGLLVITEQESSSPDTVLEYYWYDHYLVGFWEVQKGYGYRAIAWMNDTAYIFPEKMSVKVLPNNRGFLSPMEKSYNGPVTFEDGWYAGETAEKNTIRISGNIGYFKEGDAVTISGSNIGNNKTIIIREIAQYNDNTYLRFSDLEFVFQHDNRLWGVKNNTILASKLGDPLNWNVFDGLASDSYAVDVGSSRDFTGCCSYNGYPVFFKEDHIYKVYGTRPQNYQLQDTMTLGVEKGSSRSLAIASETLYYKSTAGIMAYNGSVPRNISREFGDVKYTNAVGGSDSEKYYVYMNGYIYRNGQVIPQGDSIFVYDPRYNIWCREDNAMVKSWTCNEGDLIFVERYYDSDREQWLTRLTKEKELSRGVAEPFWTAENTIESYVEFGDFVVDSANKKGLSKIGFRISVGENSEAVWTIQYDYDGVWNNIYDSATHEAEITQCDKRSYYRPLTPMRCDNYKLRLTASGDWKLYSLSRDEYIGSELQKH